MAEFAPRYARAFADVISEHNLDSVAILASLHGLAGLMAESEPLRKVMASPSVPASQKHKLLDALLEKMGGVPPVERNFLAVIIDHGRIGSLAAIVTALELEFERRMGRVPAEITSIRELGAEERVALLEKIAALTGKAVAPSYKVNKSLLGGAVVRVGSTVYDGSVRGQLLRIKESLRGA